ncbi:transposase domain-containing protein [Streptomyces sp. NPDC057428]|uniref:transposase domain-containing protein n=1 Tax=Streptomyces sp. NPDC057428 TaxID=3346129 RepID=UPI0036A2FD15
MRKIPARVVVYLLLAAALFEECGYLAVWRKLTVALEAIPVAKITGTALWDARTRLGVRPMRALFDLLRGPATAIRTGGARFDGLLTVAIDGTYLDVPDSPLHRAHLGKGTNQYATSGYPQICLTALVACCTRAVLDAAFGRRSSGETVYGKRLMRSLHASVIVLLDRALFLEHVPGRGWRHRGRLPRPRLRRPQTAGPGPLRRRLLPLPLRRPRGPCHRVRDHHHHQSGPPDRALPAGHQPP